MYKFTHDKLTIYEVEAVKKELLSLLENSGNEIILDMSDIQKIDIAAIQLFISMLKSAQQRSKKFSLDGLNANLKQTLHLCGCDKVLEVNHE